MIINKVQAASLVAFFLSTAVSSVTHAAAPVADVKASAPAKTVQPASRSAKTPHSSSVLRPDVRLSRVERASEARGKVLLQLQNDISQLSDQMAILSGKLEEHSYQLEQVLKRQRELYQELERRVAADYSAASAMALKSSVSSAQALTSVQAPAVTRMQSDDKVADKAYDAAVSLVIKDKKYTEAIPAFQHFIKTYPDSAFRPNAHYWLGQLLYSQGDKTGAISEFKTLTDNYKDSNKRGDSLHKLGIIYLSLGENAKAKSYFEQVIKEYPSGGSASLAQDELKKMQ